MLSSARISVSAQCFFPVEVTHHLALHLLQAFTLHTLVHHLCHRVIAAALLMIIRGYVALRRRQIRCCFCDGT